MSPGLLQQAEKAWQGYIRFTPPKSPHPHPFERRCFVAGYVTRAQEPHPKDMRSGGDG